MINRVEMSAAGVLVLLAAACGGAAAPTPELVTARNVYTQARNGEAARLNPAGVHDAFEALKAAEAVHDDDAGSQREKHYAYIALRRSELAISGASEALARNEQQRAEETYKSQLQQQSQLATQQSSQFAEQLSDTQRALQQHTQQLQQRQGELEEARVAAERAEAELRNMEAVREEEGRLVISLSGVLFETGGDKLSELAQRRLDTVAQALAAYPERPIVVEGYTDAQGSESSNRALSQRRADAVREYLEGHGVPAERIRAVGKGEDDPVASNETPEGRANNRRVEIVVDRGETTPSSRDQREGAAPEDGLRPPRSSSTQPEPPGSAEPNQPANPSTPSTPGAPPAQEPASP